MRYTKLLLMISAAAVLASCESISLEPELADDELGTRGTAPFAAYAGQSLVSGQPIPAIVEGGIAPISFEKSISIHIVGTHYSGNNTSPDLFFQHNSGAAVGNAVRYFSFKSLSKDGRLVYNNAVGVGSYPWESNQKKTRIFDLDGTAYSVTVTAKEMSIAIWNPSTNKFGGFTKTVSVEGLPSSPSSIDVVVNSSSSISVYCIHADGKQKDETMDYLEQGYFDALGIWRGSIGNSMVSRFDVSLPGWETSPAVILRKNEVVRMPYSICGFSDPDNNVRGVIVGGKFGSLKFIRDTGDEGGSEALYLTDGKDNPVIYSGVNHRMITLGTSDNKYSTDFLVTGEGAPYLFKFTGKYDSNGSPIYGREEYVLHAPGDLFGSSLTVPTVVDWDRDGVLDLVSGNSDGRILFYKNYASSEKPAFGDPVYLQSCGEEIHFRAGYYEVQGPDDGGAWGYICPNVIDWNEDGIPDIVTSSNVGKVELMLGTGKEGADCLGPRQNITIDGMELYGMWRVRPGVAKVGDEIWLVFMDGEDAVHLYKKSAATSVSDCGRLKMTDGGIMTGHFNISNGSSMGYQGREKIEICDWDGDGDMDLLIAGPKNMSMPDEATGLPYHGNTNQLHAVFIENVGGDESPVFKRPVQLLYKGMSTAMSLGGHAQSISACRLGDSSAGLNIVLGCEGGKFWFFRHDDITYYSNAQ